ncbi:MAG: preprotein translocase subunit SecE [Pseudomonadales bacterium]|jgi:preprotein translocase subunit SecE|nr:preprotein translocase subunit SecE [Pseudomonadales bacterium]MCP5332256.1 preprotein translocase subunit SecE [Pseudomonadales bacterium]HMU90976.1 preprotein translocase subunit SecE [Pseudomonadales bacterium]HMW15812.1 preprotein translocase subunit SecE [Pseudomonadales bacterium]HMW84096.1 preprotein translocase subunit SecE [Pseudomonadales bacterium]
MAASSNSESGALDKLKWGVVVLLALVAVVGNQYYAEQFAVIYRAMVLVVVGAVAAVIALQTDQGKRFIAFAKESRVEIRKVVWPTRQETQQTTLVVVAIVLIAALILWALDSLLGWLVSIVIG